MSNLFDYLLWRGDLSMEQSGFNAVDSLILCCLSYVSFQDVIPETPMDNPVTLAEAARLYFHLHPGGGFKKDRTGFSGSGASLLALLSDCRRFSRMRLQCYVDKIDDSHQEQFSAVTILLEDGSSYAAFRGTDDTLVGWKEDFDMGWLNTVPSQQEALSYLTRMARRRPGPIRAGGHSKGGNLAVYAAAFCDPKIQARITAVYNNDGPGFHKEIITSHGFRAMAGRIHTFVPQSSVIGMLLDHEERYVVVHSTQSGLLQHDPYSWEVDRKDFVRLDTVDDTSRLIDKTLRSWILDMNEEHRARFVDALYQILTATQAKTVGELTAGWSKNAGIMLQSYKNMDAETRKLVSRTLLSLFETAARNISFSLARPPEKKKRPRLPS